MSTPNFASNINVLNTYAIGMNVYYDKEIIEEYGLDPELEGQFDEMDTEANYEADIENIKYDLENKFGFSEDAAHTGTGTYSRPGNVIASKEVRIEVCNTPVYVNIQATVTSGYYEGSNLDFEVSVEDFYGWSYDGDLDESDCQEILKNHYVNAGLAKIHAKTLKARIEAVIEKYRIILEGVYAAYSDHILFKCAQFSNGEAWYQAVNDESKVRESMYQEALKQAA